MDGGPRPALPVPEAGWEGPGEAGEAAGPPASAEEYLRRVRREAAGLPAVFVAAAPPPEDAGEGAGHRPGGRGGGFSAAEGPAHSLPAAAWLAAFPRWFGGVRARLAAARARAPAWRGPAPPRGRDPAAWRAFCLGGRHGEGGEGVGRAPTVSLLAAVDAATVPWLLRQHVRWATAARDGGGAGAPSALQAQWLFALAAGVASPADADTQAAFRALLKHLCRARAATADGADPRIPALNALIAVAGGYFRQDAALAAAAAEQGAVEAEEGAQEGEEDDGALGRAVDLHAKYSAGAAAAMAAAMG